MGYQTFVVTRIEELVDQAKRERELAGRSTDGAADPAGRAPCPRSSRWP